MITGLVIAWLRRYFSLRTISILLILSGIILFVIGMFTYYYLSQNTALFIIHGIIAIGLFVIGVIFLYIDYKRQRGINEALKILGIEEWNVTNKPFSYKVFNKTDDTIDKTLKQTYSFSKDINKSNKSMPKKIKTKTPNSSKTKTPKKNK